MEYSKNFLRFNWLSLVLIYLVVIAGSFVRITGSGMGCPDWPKCFGEWIPPVSANELPENYKENYSNKRLKKIDRFSSFLNVLGMEKTANELSNDPELKKEESFNVRKTWTEYINRLFGFLAGNAVLIVFLWVLWKYRKRKLIFFSALNLLLLVIQAWFGSIVVASNLVPWTITVHLLLALIIIGIQLYIIRIVSPSQRNDLQFSNGMFALIWACFIITVYQMFLGTQVREYIDELTRQGIGKEDWSEMLGLSYFIHRSFSWLVMILLGILTYFNQKNRKYPTIQWIFIILAVELISGVLLAHADLPGLVRTAHLIFASCILGILTMVIYRLKRVRV
jgi:heme a synthase